MNETVQKVSVSDVSMPFGSMVVFILKWTLASIPAMLIIFLVALVIAGLFGGLFTALQRGATV
jgi:CDP-diglyceride synthetase